MNDKLELPLKGETMKGPAVEQWEAWKEANNAQPANALVFAENYKKIKGQAHDAIRQAFSGEKR